MKVSNFRINFNKSAALWISAEETWERDIQTEFPYKWESDYIKYLGVLIPRELSKVFDLNFQPMLEIIKKDLERWNRGLYSWFGRVNIVKMILLPQILYLMAALPIKIPRRYFEKLQSLIGNFIWAGKSARLKQQIMMRPKENGGMAIPNFYQYYQAIHCVRVLDWYRHREHKEWVSIEQKVGEGTIQGCLWNTVDPPRKYKKHPLVGTTIQIFRSLLKKNRL